MLGPPFVRHVPRSPVHQPAPAPAVSVSLPGAVGSPERPVLEALPDGVLVEDVSVAIGPCALAASDSVGPGASSFCGAGALGQTTPGHRTRLTRAMSLSFVHAVVSAVYSTCRKYGPCPVHYRQ